MNMRAGACVLVLLIGLFLVGCGGSNRITPPIFANRLDALYSPNGSVDPAAKAFTPNGLYYVKLMAPYDEGYLGLYARADDHLVRQLRVLPVGASNDMKGVAWSPDSRFLAVMYHGGARDGVYLYNARTGDVIRRAGDGSRASVYYHFMVFQQDGMLYLSERGTVVDQQFSSGLTPALAQSSGANLPWIHYGWDIGRNPWGGAPEGFSGNTTALNEDLRYLAQHGVRLVRVFTFCDLRSGVLFDAGGMPTGFDAHALDDFEALLDTADAVGVRVIPVLFDYTLADGVAMEGANAVGEHPNVITSAAARTALLDILKPLIRRYHTRATIYSWEIINEPEYVTTASAEEVNTFVNACVAMIHAESPTARVTLGCRNRDDVARWTSAGFDLYQFHHYDSMEGQLPLATPVAQVGVSKPVLIGECQPTMIRDKMDIAAINGYAGMLFWSLNADYDFTAVADEYAGWCDAHLE